MRILYVAKHQSGDNDDEGAIRYALEQLGHEVICVHERQRSRPLSIGNPARMNALKADLCLFHKWPNSEEIRHIKCQKALWYFDMVESITNDPTLEARSKARVQWFSEVEPWTDLLFCTDGDFVSKRNFNMKNEKYRWLPQGADERVVGKGVPIPVPEGKMPSILFTGMINHGQERVRQLTMLKERYGDEFWILGDSGSRGRKHGRELADIIASIKVVVAPSGPSTDRYWSNRIFQALGFGAFLLHPKCQGLDKFYKDVREYFSYESDGELCHFLDANLSQEDNGWAIERLRIQSNGLQTTLEKNLYRHRVVELLAEVEKLK